MQMNCIYRLAYESARVKYRLHAHLQDAPGA